jgi:hypothetical protein
MAGFAIYPRKRKPSVLIKIKRCRMMPAAYSVSFRSFNGLFNAHAVIPAFAVAATGMMTMH